MNRPNTSDNQEQSNLNLEARSSEQAILEPFFAVLIMILAALGNVLVIFTIYRNKTLRTIPNAFLLNLFVTNFLMALTILPVFIWTLVHGKWTFGDGFCVVQGFQNLTLFSVTLLTLTAISINRFIRIVYPIIYLYIYTRKRVYGMIAGIWVFCLLSSTSPFLGLGRYEFNQSTALCTTGGTNQIFRFITHIVMAIVIIIIAICNIRIIKTVRNHTHNLKLRKERVTNKDSTLQERRGDEIFISKSISIVVSVFAFCWIPTYLMDSLEAHSIMVPRVPRLLGIFTILMDTVVNPFVFGLTNRKFRVAIANVFRESFCRRAHDCKIKRRNKVVCASKEAGYVINVCPINTTAV